MLSSTSLRHWVNNFYGYGSWSAPFWFVSFEEGGGDLPEEVAEKFDYFMQNHPQDEPTLCNVRELYRLLTYRDDGPKAERYSTMYEYRFEKHAIQNTIWRNLTAFEHGYLGKKVPEPLAYQRKHFADPERATETLIPFLPLPSPHNHAWYYSWLDMPEFPWLKSRHQYQQEMYTHRITTILDKITTYQPRVVLMYGMSNINGLKDSFSQMMAGLKFKMMKGTKLSIPQHHRAEYGKTTILITTQIPALRHNRVETGFDWEEFGKLVKAGY